MTSDSAERIVDDFRRDGWQSKPMERTVKLVVGQPSNAAKLVSLALQTIEGSATFVDFAIGHMPEPTWADLVSAAIERLKYSKENEMAESIVAYASLQAPETLHPHLKQLYHLAPNEHTYYGLWPWHMSGTTGVAELSAIVSDTSMDRAERYHAWFALLETRDPNALKVAISLWNETDVSHERPDIDLNDLLAEVGYWLENKKLVRLYPETTLHLRFPDEYLLEEDVPWLAKVHSTWTLEHCSPFSFRFGGGGLGACSTCGEAVHHFLSLSPVPEGLGVSGLQKLSIQACLSCLGWEAQEQFFKHDVDGGAADLLNPGEPVVPEFPAKGLKETRVHLCPTPKRWRRQDWALANGRENLHRLGGIPCWIQSAEHHECPSCSRPMPFLMQLDSNLPTVDNNEWLWGSGGIVYVLWCDACRVSCVFWQCT